MDRRTSRRRVPSRGRNPEMFTSNFASLAQLQAPAIAIRISRGAPRWKGGWQAQLPPGIQGRDDLRLAPTWAALKASSDDPATYHRAFAAALRQLDPRKVYDELGEN